jgi:hypothetical protein
VVGGVGGEGGGCAGVRLWFIAGLGVGAMVLGWFVREAGENGSYLRSCRPETEQVKTSLRTPEDIEVGSADVHPRGAS